MFSILGRYLEGLKKIRNLRRNTSLEYTTPWTCSGENIISSVIVQRFSWNPNYEKPTFQLPQLVGLELRVYGYTTLQSVLCEAHA